MMLMKSNDPIRSSLIRTDSLESFDDRRHFLEILHQILDESENNNGYNIISWTSDGLSFIVHDSEKFEQILLPSYFSMSSTKLTSYKSFLGQLKTYGFYRSANKKEFNHPMFARDKKTTLFSRRKSVESWPMPNLAIKRAAESNKNISSSCTFPRQITISDLKKQNNNSFIGRRRSSIVRSNSPVRRLSFKDTLLSRRRSSSGTLNINQSTYLEILRDLSISERPQPSKDVTMSHQNFGNNTDDDLSVNDLEPLDISYAEDVVNNLSSYDVERLTMNRNETEEDKHLYDDTTLFNDIEDDAELYKEIADVLGDL